MSWGLASNSLRMGISTSGVSSAEGMMIDMVLENVGTSDFTLNLGFMLANGKAMFPDALPAGSTTSSWHCVAVPRTRALGRRAPVVSRDDGVPDQFDTW